VSIVSLLKIIQHPTDFKLECFLSRSIRSTQLLVLAAIKKIQDGGLNSNFLFNRHLRFTRNPRNLRNNNINTHTPKKISSGVVNWYLDEFFEEFIYGRWYIYLEQTIYHLCQPISCWLSSLAVEYRLLWTIISYVAWYSSPADDIQRKQMILIWRGWYSSRADNIQLKQLILSDGDDIHLE
jgi:hypothetical protein